MDMDKDAIEHHPPNDAVVVLSYLN